MLRIKGIYCLFMVGGGVQNQFTEDAHAVGIWDKIMHRPPNGSTNAEPCAMTRGFGNLGAWEIKDQYWDLFFHYGE